MSRIHENPFAKEGSETHGLHWIDLRFSHVGLLVVQFTRFNHLKRNQVVRHLSPKKSGYKINWASFKKLGSENDVEPFSRKPIVFFTTRDPSWFEVTIEQPTARSYLSDARVKKSATLFCPKNRFPQHGWGHKFPISPWKTPHNSSFEWPLDTCNLGWCGSWTYFWKGVFPISSQSIPIFNESVLWDFFVFEEHLLLELQRRPPNPIP